MIPNRVSAMTKRLDLTVLIAFAALFLWAGCASSASRAPSKASEPMNGSVHPGKTKAAQPEARPKVEAETASPRDPAPAPTEQIKIQSVHGESEEGSVFEGDVFEDDLDDLREEIDALVAQIREDSGSVRGGGDVEDPGGRQPGSCQEVCDLSEAICTSSDKICGISDSNPEEGYFLERCRWSQGECRSAGQQCSVCAP